MQEDYGASSSPLINDLRLFDARGGPRAKTKFLLCFHCVPTRYFLYCLNVRIAVKIFTALTVISSVLTLIGLFAKTLLFLSGHSIPVRVVSTVMAIYGVIAGYRGYIGSSSMTPKGIHIYYVYLMVHVCLSFVRLIASSIEVQSRPGESSPIDYDITLSATSIFNMFIDGYLLYIVWSLLEIALETVDFHRSAGYPRYPIGGQMITVPSYPRHHLPPGRDIFGRTSHSTVTNFPELQKSIPPTEFWNCHTSVGTEPRDQFYDHPMSKIIPTSVPNVDTSYDNSFTIALTPTPLLPPSSLYFSAASGLEPFSSRP